MTADLLQHLPDDERAEYDRVAALLDGRPVDLGGHFVGLQFGESGRLSAISDTPTAWYIASLDEDRADTWIVVYETVRDSGQREWVEVAHGWEATRADFDAVLASAASQQEI